MRSIFLAGILTAVMIFAAPARAQLVTSCTIYDTTVLSSGNAGALTYCPISTGPYDEMMLFITGEVTCGPLSDLGLTPTFGTGGLNNPHQIYPALGANFVGSISGGVLTVTSMITPMPTFTIGPGQTLSDANNGTQIPIGATTCAGAPCNGSTVTVTAQIDGAPGGVGHYSVSDGTITIGSETMWALNVSAPLGKPPATVGGVIIEETQCQQGTRDLMTIHSASRNFFVANTILFIQPLIAAEQIAGRPVQSASFKKGQISAFAPAKIGPGPYGFGMVQ